MTTKVARFNATAEFLLYSQNQKLLAAMRAPVRMVRLPTASLKTIDRPTAAVKTNATCLMSMGVVIVCSLVA